MASQPTTRLGPAARHSKEERPLPPLGPRAAVGLVGWQILYEQRSFWRNPRRAVTSFAFPLMFLLIFGGIVHGKVKALHDIPFINFYVPGIIAYAVMVIGFSNTAMYVAYLRHDGILRRVRTTPMPVGLYLAAAILSNVLTIVAAVAVLLLVGVAFYGANLNASALPGFLLTLALASAAMTALGIAVARLMPRPDSGAPILMFITLPLSFISDVFFPLEKGAHVLREIGEIFPLYHIADGLQPLFEPFSRGGGAVQGDVVALLIWAAVGVLALRRTARALFSRE